MSQGASSSIRKVKPPPEYPPEEGHYLRGNDCSPAAVVILLHTFYDKIPDYLGKLASVAIESGAALAGMLQTENVGIEKIICNIVANPISPVRLYPLLSGTGSMNGGTIEDYRKAGGIIKRKVEMLIQDLVSR